MENWKERKVKDICQVGRGRVISQNEIADNPGIYPVFSSQTQNKGEMGRISSYDFDGEYVTWTTDGAYAGTVFYRSGKFNCTNVCGTLKPKNDDELDLLFFSYLLATEAYNHVSFVGNPKLMNGVMAEISLKIPISKTEQKRIAEILSTADEAIEQTGKLIDKYTRVRRGLMQDLLTGGIDERGNLRSKQTHKFTVKNGIEVPDDWDVVKLGELLNNNGFIQTGPFGSQLHSYEYTTEGIPVIMPQDMWDEISTKNINRISETKANELSRHRVRVNDVIFARRGDLTRCNVIQPNQVGWLCGTGCILLRQQKKVFNPDWLRLFYKSFYGQLQVSINAVGSTMVNLSGALLKDLWIYKIEIEEQNRIVEKVNQINKTIQSFIEHLAKLQAIKKGLMQDLLSGNKRVKTENENGA